MKKLLAILVVATMLVSIIAMTPVLNAATADIVVQSGEGTAVVDGVKDDVYDTAQVLEFTQKGTNNGGGEVFDTPQGYAYVINDAENVYVFFSVLDSSLDNTSANNYEQDSVDVFWMKDNSKQQWRLHYDGLGEADSGTVPDGMWAVQLTDAGYDIELYFPITDVKDNQVEMCLQINACTDGKRDCTIYIPGNAAADDAYQRSNRQAEYDVWWTLQLTGDHEETRVDPEPEAEEITVKNYESIANRAFGISYFIQDQATWSYWNTLADGGSVGLGETLEIAVDFTLKVPADALTPELTNDYTTIPKFRMSFSDGAMVEGDKGEYNVSIGDIVITAEGYENVVIPAQDIDFKLAAEMADWGLSGNAREIEMANAVTEQLGLSIEQFCTEYLPALTGLTTTFTYNTYNLNTKEVVDAFIESLEAMETEWCTTNETIAAQLEKAQNALASAKAAPEDPAVLADALKDATAAKNRSDRERESGGWAEGGIADTYIKDNIQSIVDEIQGMVDAAAPAEPEPADEPTDDAPANEPNTPASSSTSEGGSTGLVVGIIIAIVVVVVAAVAGVVLSKKKK